MVRDRKGEERKGTLEEELFGVVVNYKSKLCFAFKYFSIF